MTDDVYAPRAPLRPTPIIQAIALLWISSALGLAASRSELTDPAQLVVSVVVMLAISVSLTIALWKGRNWARFLYLILVILSLANFVSLWGLVERPASEMALEAVSFVADAGSFFLMFTEPGASWFRDPNQPQV